MKQQLTQLILGLSFTGSLLAQVSVTGPSSSQTPYLQPLAAGSTITSVMTAGDAVNGYTMVGLPDGLGAFDNGDGTFTVLMNHEMGATIGAVHAHGSTGGFVSKWVINKSTLAVVSAGDLTQTMNLWAGSTYSTYNSTNTSTLAAMARLCSADLPPVSAFYNSQTGKGTQARIFMNGEETGPEGRAFAHVATGTAAGNTYELPHLGRASWESYVSSPFEQDKTITIGMDDATPGQVYVYIGTKQTSGSEVVKAGLTGGKLYGVAVLGLLNEGSSVPAANSIFNLIDLGNVSALSGATLNANSNNVGVTNFLRPEDGAWDPSNPRDFYFLTTNSFTSPSRMWRLRFTDIANPELGGTITAVLNGTEGPKMMDNLGINKYGQILIQEDPGGQAHNAKIWQYNINSASLSLFAQHDTTRFIPGAANFLTFDEESSGVIDMQEILGPGKWLICDQAHYTPPNTALVEGGQLLIMHNASSALANPEINIQGNAVSIALGSTVTALANNTNFGPLNLSTQLVKPFVIQNSGPGVLSVKGVSIGGLNAGDFALISPPVFPYTVAVNGTLTIYVRFIPATNGQRNGNVTIFSNDFDEENYKFSISGTGVSPEINLTGNATSIADGSSSYLVSNNTDFGSTLLNIPMVRTYEIQNTGTGTLLINAMSINGNNSSEFSFANNNNLPVSVLAGGSYSFAIQFLPQSAGTKTAGISLSNNDADEMNYSFLISAKGLMDVGLQSIAGQNQDFSVFPNPSAEYTNLEISSETASSAELKVVAVDGKVVMEETTQLNEGSTTIKLSTASFANGIYFIQIKTANTTLQSKVIVNH
jgi:hypothetical protein